MLKIKDKDIGIIKEYAIHSFKNRKDFSGLENKEIQIYCIIDGLSSFLLSNGIPPRFYMEGFKQEDSDSVDDFGPDTMPEKQSKMIKKK